MGTTRTPERARNQTCEASLPAPIVWTIAAIQTRPVRRCSRRQRAAPIRLRM